MAMGAAYPDLPEESDLVPGVYEGGLKVWEASLDLVEHLVCPRGGSGLFAQDGAIAATGRTKSVLEVRSTACSRCVQLRSRPRSTEVVGVRRAVGLLLRAVFRSGGVRWMGGGF